MRLRLRIPNDWKDLVMQSSPIYVQVGVTTLEAYEANVSESGENKIETINMTSLIQHF
jgi:hypothetical protein